MPRGRPRKKTEAPKQQSFAGPLTTTLILPCYWVNQELIEMTERCLLSYAESSSLVDQLILVNDGSPHGMIPDAYF